MGYSDGSLGKSLGTLSKELKDLYADIVSGVVSGGSSVSSGQENLSTIAASGAAQTINFATASVWDITLTANCTFTLTGAVAGKACALTVIRRQDGTGSRTETWPGSVTWLGTGIAPTLQTAASSVDSVVLMTDDGGTTWFGIAQTSASGLRSGTAFPGSPADGDLFYRTDRSVLYFYKNSISRWLSVEKKKMFLAFNSGISAIQGIGQVPLEEDIYLETWATQTKVQTTNDGSNNWTVTLFGVGASSNTSITSFTTSADTVNVNALHSVTVNAIQLASSYVAFLCSVNVKTGAPGTFSGSSEIIYRSAG